MASFINLTTLSLICVAAILPCQKVAAQYVAGPQMQQQQADHSNRPAVWQAPKPTAPKTAKTSSTVSATRQQQLDQYDGPGLWKNPKVTVHKPAVSSSGASATMQQQLDQYDRPGLWKSPQPPVQKTATQGLASLQNGYSSHSGAPFKGARAPRPDPPWAPPAANMQLPRANFSANNAHNHGRKPSGAHTAITSSQMEQMLNQYDQSNLWNHGPNNQAAAQSRLQPGAFNPNSARAPFPQSATVQAPFFPMQNRGPQGGFGQMMSPASGMFGGQQAPSQPAQPPVSPFAALFGGAPPQPKAPPPPANPMQAMLRMFLGDGSSSGSDAQNQEKTGNAQSYLQTANDAASRAQSACERASYGSDIDARKSAAQEAYYAAQAARGAADSATGAAQGGPSEANDAAAQARDAADRAQAAADRASANASGSGW